MQSLIDAASPGATVVAPGGCVYRETVAITKPLTLEGAPGAEIRGSDVWTGWRKDGERWVRGGLPNLSAGKGVRCNPGTDRCLWPEQVFFDGRPLEQVASDPHRGQFAVDTHRNVVLADDPAGHTVEVSVRGQWIVGRAGNVTVRGFTMKHAANARGFGAITNRDDEEGNYHWGWTIEGNTLSDAHAAVLRIDGGDLKVLNNDISRGGQLGIHGDGENILVEGNRIHNNNTEGFDQGWEAGGAKFATGVNNLTVNDNAIFSNRGGGFWCDLDCEDVVYSNNRVHHNWGSGLHFEISSGAKIYGNVVWENGWRYHTDSRVWAAGIKVSCSSNVEVYDNVMAWNASGLTVLHYPREEPRWNIVENVYVHDNTFLVGNGPSLSWVQQDGWAEGMMTDSRAANNWGQNNRYWYAGPEGNTDRFRHATTTFSDLTQFNATPGEENGSYVTDAEKDKVVSSAGIPSYPEPSQGETSDGGVRAVTFKRYP
jgi:hypothetical protein